MNKENRKNKKRERIDQERRNEEENTKLWECNDLFSRFEQQILFLEKQAEMTEPTTDRHGHDGPSRGLVLKHLEILKIGY